VILALLLINKSPVKTSKKNKKINQALAVQERIPSKKFKQQERKIKPSQFKKEAQVGNSRK
jgi:hypothetical protein